MADQYRESYRDASRKEKTVIVQQLVDSWRAEDPPGRFLTRTDPSNADESLWHDVGNEMALKKAAKILTEKASSTPKVSKKRQATETSSKTEEHGGSRQRQRRTPQKQPPPQPYAQSQRTYTQSQQPPYPPFASLPQANAQFPYQQTIPVSFPHSQGSSADTRPYMSLVAGLPPAFVVALSEPSLNLGQQQVVPMSFQQLNPANPSAAIGNQLRGQQQAFLAGGTPIQPQRLHLTGAHSGVSFAQGVAQDTQLLQQDAKDDSPPIRDGAADAVPIAASLAGVFNSSSSASTIHKGDSPPSADDSK